MYTNYINSNYYRVHICKCQHVFTDFDFRARLRFSRRSLRLASNQLLERPKHMKPALTTKKQTMNQTL